MPFPALETTVRPDWQDLTREMTIRRLRLWRAIEIVVTLAALASLALGLLFPSWFWSRAVALGLFPIVFWMLTVWTILRGRLTVRQALSRAVAVAAVLFAAAMVALLTTPLTAMAGEGVWARGSVFLSALIPLLTWPILLWIGRAFPGQLRALGLLRGEWPVQLVVGAGAGAALGLHLLLAAGLTTEFPQISTGVLPPVVWVFFFQIGLFALGEELLFRGLAYELLLGVEAVDPGPPILRIAALNTLVYLAAWPGLGLEQPGLTLWFLGYAATLALLTTFLRHRLQSLLPGLACRVAFFVLAILAFVS